MLMHIRWCLSQLSQEAIFPESAELRETDQPRLAEVHHRSFSERLPGVKIPCKDFPHLPGHPGPIVLI